MKLFDTHAHLNFGAFSENVREVIIKARQVGVEHIVIPGTDITSSKKAIEIAQNYEGVCAAVGIHPHHVYEEMQKSKVTSQKSNVKVKIDALRALVQSDAVVAIGEIGLDRHMYQKTKYGEYEVNEEFMDLQKEYLVAQLTLAHEFSLPVILHNREAKQDLLPILTSIWDSVYSGAHYVFHCCEPDFELLEYAKDRQIFIGVDGDVTYSKRKQDFITKVPLEMLVVETDSPFLIPEPLKSQKKFPNTPSNLPLIIKCVADLKGRSEKVIAEISHENAMELFFTSRLQS